MSSKLFHSISTVVQQTSRTVSTIHRAQTTSLTPALWSKVRLQPYVSPRWLHSTIAASYLAGVCHHYSSQHQYHPASSTHGENKQRRSGLTSVYYICAIGVFMVGMSYAGVPLYRMFCQSAGLGGQAIQSHDGTMVETMAPAKDCRITIRFNADISSSMQWNFKPQQTEITVTPGETALAFYTATNPTDKPIIGISTYNVIPYEAGKYFNKIQCFCFEEQMLNPKEQVDMPVFFFIDPEFAEDPMLEMVDTITLSYTFFEAKDGFEVPLPAFMR